MDSRLRWHCALLSFVFVLGGTIFLSYAPLSVSSWIFFFFYMCALSTKRGQHKGRVTITYCLILSILTVDVVHPSTKSSLASLFVALLERVLRQARKTNQPLHVMQRERKSENKNKNTVELCGCCIYISLRGPCIVFNHHSCIVFFFFYCGIPFLGCALRYSCYRLFL